MNPFSSAPGPQGQGNLVAPGAVRRLARFLKDFEIKADPGIIVVPDGNGIRLQLDPSVITANTATGANFPFRVTGAGGNLHVAPGTVKIDAQLLGGGIADVTFTPEIGGIALDSPLSSAGNLSIGSLATGYVMLIVEYSRYGGAINWPFNITFKSDGNYEDTPLQRYDGEVEGVDAFIHLELCRIVNGQPTHQIIRSNLFLRFVIDVLYLCGAAEPIG